MLPTILVVSFIQIQIQYVLCFFFIGGMFDGGWMDCVAGSDCPKKNLLNSAHSVRINRF